MDSSDSTLQKLRLDKSRRWTTLAWVGWTVALSVVALEFLLRPTRTLGFSPYWRAALNWIAGKKLYIYVANKGFVYGPFAAVSLVPLTVLPSPVANAVWRVFSGLCIVGGLWCVMRVGPFASIPARLRGVVYLLALPLSLSNLDTGQANPMVLGLILAAIAAAYTERWTWTALALAMATHWKVYPIAVAMLIMLLSPWKFGWRFVFFLILLGVAPFLFQKASYVAEQYRLWVDTRIHDDRTTYNPVDAPLDFWYISVRMLGLPLSKFAYQLLQLASAGGIALFCLYGRFRRWDRERIYGGLLCLVSGWMLLFGPASEWLTYVLLSPVVALALVESFNRPVGTLARALVVLAYALLMLAALRVGFKPRWDAPILLSLQPFAAGFFMIYGLVRYGWDWPKSPDPELQMRHAE